MFSVETLLIVAKKMKLFLLTIRSTQIESIFVFVSFLTKCDCFFLMLPDQCFFGAYKSLLAADIFIHFKRIT